MRHWLTIFLLLVVPIQIAWAATASYCGHEASAVSGGHFGHHEHRHQADGTVTPAVDDGTKDTGTYHADCETCHLGASATLVKSPLRSALTGSMRPIGQSPTPYPSHISSGPERPNRIELIAAARSAGGVEFRL